MNSLVAAVILGIIISGLMAVMRSRDDADKGTGAYIVKAMIITIPVIYLGLTYLSANGGMTGGGNIGASSSSLEMRTGIPDF